MTAEAVISHDSGEVGRERGGSDAHDGGKIRMVTAVAMIERGPGDDRTPEVPRGVGGEPAPEVARSASSRTTTANSGT